MEFTWISAGRASLATCAMSHWKGDTPPTLSAAVAMARPGARTVHCALTGPQVRMHSQWRVQAGLEGNRVSDFLTPGSQIQLWPAHMTRGCLAVPSG